MTVPRSNSDYKLFILLPAYNEEKALTELVPAIGCEMRAEGISFEICVVDDGSRDGTAALLAAFSKEWPIRTLRHDTNKGYGAALSTGFKWISENARPQDIALSLDADNTHSPTYFLPMIHRVQESFDVVTASYTMVGARAIGVPFKRRVFSTLANLLLRLTCRVPGTRTYTNGFRAYRVAALQKAATHYGENLIEETGFPGGTELFLKVARFGIKTSEVPFILRYDRRGGQSKIRILRTIRSYLKLITRYAGKPPISAFVASPN